MNEIIYLNVIIRLFTLMFCNYLFVKLFRMNKITNYSTIKLAILIQLTLSVGILLQILVILIIQTDFMIYLSILDGFLGISISFCIILFLSIYEENQLNPQRIFLATFLSTLTLIGFIKGFLVIQPDPIDWLLFNMFIFYFGYFVIISITSIRRMKKYMRKNQIKVVQNVLLFILISFIGVSSFHAITNIYVNVIAEDPSVFTIEILGIYFVIPPLIFLISNIFFYNGIVKPKNPSILLPQRVDKLLIIEKTGTPIFDLSLNNRGEIDSILLSGAITAISAIISEATQIAGSMKSIQFETHQIIINVKDNYSGVMFVDSPTQFLMEVLQKIMIEISKMEIETHSMTDKQNEHISKTVEELLGLQ
jgi:hypothetical protein